MRWPALMAGPVARLRERLAGAPLAARVARGAVWSLVGGLGSRSLAVVTSVLVARFLGTAGYGEMGMVGATIGTVSVFAGFGLGATATKYVAELRHRDPLRAGRVVSLVLAVASVLSFAATVACWALSETIAVRMLARASLAPLVAAGAVLVLASTLESVVTSVLAGFEAFRGMARIAILQGVAAPFVTLPLVWLHGVAGAVAAMTVNAALGLALSSLLLRRELRRAGVAVTFGGAAWGEFGVLGRFAVPSLLSSLLLAPVMWLTNLILVARPGGYAELGVFNAANQWRMAIVFVPGMIASAVLPVLADTWGGDDRTGYRATFELNLRSTWAVALPMTVVVILLAGPLAAIYGRQFSGVSAVLPALMTATFLGCVNVAVGGALSGSGRAWTGMLMNFAWAAAVLAAAAALVPSNGARGLAWAYLISYLLHTVWQIAYVERRLAAGVVRSQGLLFGLTAVVLSLCFVPWGAGPWSLAPRALLLGAACLPALGLVRRAFPGAGVAS